MFESKNYHLKKYRINEYLGQLSEGKRRKQIEYCCKKLQRSLSQFNKIRAAEFGDTAAASSDQLLVLAKCFKCKVDDLLNKPPMNEGI